MPILDVFVARFRKFGEVAGGSWTVPTKEAECVAIE